MKLNISRKLLAAFLGLTLAVLIATLGLARWSFEKGFLDYVNALEQDRLSFVAEELASTYRQQGNSWEGLSARQFKSILRHHAPRGGPDGKHRPPPPPLDGGYPPPGAPPPPLEADFLPPGPPPGPPPGDRAAGERPPFPGKHRPPPGFPPPGPPPPPAPPTALFDASGHRLLGAPSQRVGNDYISVPVVVGGQTVGELRSAPKRQFNTAQETAFSRQQWITSLVIGAASLLLAVLISLGLTRALLSPIKRLINAVAQLSHGDFSTRMNESRADELGRLMNDLDTLAVQLEQNQSARQRWLADISHELRTPVTVLTGEIEALKDGIRAFDKPQLRSLDQETARLRHLIDDLYQLSLSDIGGLRYSFSPLPLCEPLESAVASIAKRAEDKGLRLAISCNPRAMVSGDQQRLMQLFVNLLENSLAYTDAPGAIEITMRVDTDQKTVAVTIEDTPPGVDAESCHKLFDPLYRKDASRSRRTAGAGLGLAICKNIIEAHQGQVTASPAAAGGLRTALLLPLYTGPLHG